MWLFLISSVSSLHFLLNFNGDTTLQRLTIGRVEISYNNRIYSICPSSFDQTHANYICRSMGFERYRWYKNASQLEVNPNGLI